MPWGICSRRWSSWRFHVRSLFLWAWRSAGLRIVRQSVQRRVGFYFSSWLGPSDQWCITSLLIEVLSSNRGRVMRLVRGSWAHNRPSGPWEQNLALPICATPCDLSPSFRHLIPPPGFALYIEIRSIMNLWFISSQAVARQNLPTWAWSWDH